MRGLLSLRFRSVRGWFAATLVLVSLEACRTPPQITVPLALLLDPQVAMLDEVAPHTSFSQGRGSLLTGRGMPPLVDYGPSAYAWAVGRSAYAYFPRPVADELDFFATGAALDAPGAKPQVLTLFVNGRLAGSAMLGPRDRVIRIALPRSALRSSLNQLRLDFAWALRPCDAIPGNQDARPLAAHFSELAIVPRNLVDPATLLGAADLDALHQRARLPIGGALTLPLPPAVDLTLRAPRIEWACTDCRLLLEKVTTEGKTRRLGELAKGQAYPSSLALTTGQGIERLRFRVAASSDFDASQGLVLVFAQDFMQLSKRPLPPRHRPNLLVYLVDTLRADVLEPYGAAAGASPAVQAFAGDAVTYADAWAPSSWTLPSTVSVLTGLYPDRHGIMRGDVKLSARRSPTLAGRLADAGYESVGLSHSYVAGPEFGVDSGFSEYVTSNQLGVPRDNSFLIRRFVLSWLLGRDRRRPFFLYVHAVDPHPPYTPPSPSGEQGIRGPGELAPLDYDPLVFLQSAYSRDAARLSQLETRYLGEVRYTDRQFGVLLELLRYLRLYDDTLVALLSDHGEEFEEHGGLGHGRTVYEELLHVPLLVKYPGGRFAGQKVRTPVSTVDLAPTLLRLAAAPGVDTLDGRPLSPLSETKRRALAAEVSLDGNPFLARIDYRALRLGSLKCIHSNGPDQFGRPVPEVQAFDLAADPGERSPIPEADARWAQCRDLDARWLRIRRLLGRASDHESATEAGRSALRALGYVR